MRWSAGGNGRNARRPVPGTCRFRLLGRPVRRQARARACPRWCGVLLVQRPDPRRGRWPCRRFMKRFARNHPFGRAGYLRRRALDLALRRDSQGLSGWKFPSSGLNFRHDGRRTAGAGGRISSLWFRTGWKAISRPSCSASPLEWSSAEPLRQEWPGRDPAQGPLHPLERQRRRIGCEIALFFASTPGRNNSSRTFPRLREDHT